MGGIENLAQVAVAAIGGGGGFAAMFKLVPWLLSWSERRADKRHERLTTWEHSLVERERMYREKIEGQLGKLEKEMAEMRSAMIATRGALLEVTVELRVHAPSSEALARAEAVLRARNPLDPNTPECLIELAHKVGAKA